MPTPKNGFQILNLHLKKHIFEEKNTLFLMYFCQNLPKYYQTFIYNYIISIFFHHNKNDNFQLNRMTINYLIADNEFYDIIRLFDSYMLKICVDY